MNTSDQKPRFVYTTYIHTTPDQLWETLTNEKTIPAFWFGNKVCSEWKVGSKVESFDQDDDTLDWDGEVLESQPPHKLVYTFRDSESGEPPSKVTYLIEPVQRPAMGPTGNVVKLTLIHENFPADSKILTGISIGWPAIISGLKTLLESGQSLDLTWTPSEAS